MKTIQTILLITALVGLNVFNSYAQDQSDPSKFEYESNQVLHPEWFIKVVDWSFFTAARVTMLSSVVIENTADVAYKDIKIRLLYTTYAGIAVGQTIATDTKVLPVKVPPNSTDKYLKGGITIGAGNQDYRVSEIQVLSATPIK